MYMPIYKFPDNFKWGSATSAHQIEGDSHNDWTEWEKSDKRMAELKAKKLNPGDFISGKACDSYNRYEEDFDIAKKLNHNIHRFSIEWSRIEPEEGRFDSDAMQHYINVVKALRGRGIEPMITLWHFTNPVWFAKKGGFINIDSPKYFTRYVKYVVEHLKSDVHLWITFNEAMTVYSGFSFLNSIWPPQYKSILKWRRVNKNIIRSHIEVYKEIRRIYGSSESPTDLDRGKGHSTIGSSFEGGAGDMSHNVSIGLTESMTWSIGGNNFYEKIIGKTYNYYRNLHFWYKAFPYYDFMGLNYYHIDRRVPGSYKVLPRQDWWMEDMGWEIYPKGIYNVLKQLRRFNRPVYITENGIADSKDLTRERYIKEHLRWVWQAIQDGVDVQGYFYWSLLDNFEWQHGHTPRFGLVEVDYKTFERRIRPSALEYAKICITNQLEADL